MAKQKGLTIKIDPDDMMYTNISKSKDGYNSARLVAKVGEKVYMSISIEWEGTEAIPQFAMDLMKTIQANEIKTDEVVEGFEEELAAYEERQ